MQQRCRALPARPHAKPLPDLLAPTLQSCQREQALAWLQQFSQPFIKAGLAQRLADDRRKQASAPLS